MSFFAKLFRRPNRDSEADSGIDVYNDTDYFRRQEEGEAGQEFQDFQGATVPSAFVDSGSGDGTLQGSAHPEENHDVSSSNTERRIFNAQDWVQEEFQEERTEEDAVLGKSVPESEPVPLTPSPEPVSGPSPVEPFPGDFEDGEEEDGGGDASPTTKKAALGVVLAGFLAKAKGLRKSKPRKPPKQGKNVNADGDSKNSGAKVAILAVLLFVLAGLGYWLYGMFGPGLAAETSNGAQQGQPGGKQGKSRGTVVVESDSYEIPKNPFVSKSSIAALAAKEGVSPAKAVPGQTAQVVPPSQASSMPQRRPFVPSIPSFPAASMPQVAAPNAKSLPPTLVPSTQDIQQHQASAPARISGIVEGDDGTSVAIMSDGTVVSSGDTYQDGRIAYIGGDGIRFDNGRTMSFDE